MHDTLPNHALFVSFALCAFFMAHCESGEDEESSNNATISPEPGLLVIEDGLTRSLGALPINMTTPITIQLRNDGDEDLILYTVSSQNADSDMVNVSFAIINQLDELDDVIIKAQSSLELEYYVFRTSRFSTQFTISLKSFNGSAQEQKIIFNVGALSCNTGTSND